MNSCIQYRCIVQQYSCTDEPRNSWFSVEDSSEWERRRDSLLVTELEHCLLSSLTATVVPVQLLQQSNTCTISMVGRNNVMHEQTFDIGLVTIIALTVLE